jgi:ABC-type transport system involved in multi-copper enzyme maturation permease subunit
MITLFAVLITIIAKKQAKPDTVFEISTVASGMLQMMSTGTFQIFGIIIIVDMFTDEYRNGTLKLSMIHPVYRQEYFGAKVIALIIMTLAMLIFTMIISYLLNIIVLGTGNVEVGTQVLNIIKIYLLSSLPQIGFYMIILLAAIIIPSSGAVVGLGVGLLFLLQIAGQFCESISDYLITSYFLIFIQHNPQGQKLIFTLAVIAAYIVIFYIASSIIFKKKDILE